MSASTSYSRSPISDLGHFQWKCTLRVIIFWKNLQTILDVIFVKKLTLCTNPVRFRTQDRLSRRGQYSIHNRHVRLLCCQAFFRDIFLDLQPLLHHLKLEFSNLLSCLQLWLPKSALQDSTASWRLFSWRHVWHTVRYLLPIYAGFIVVMPRRRFPFCGSLTSTFGFHRLRDLLAKIIQVLAPIYVRTP